jgi:uncharacterized protein with GYD domain
MLTKLTNEGRKSVMNNPGRIFKVHKELEEMGAKIIAQYAVLGNFDFVNIIEAESNEAIARIAAQSTAPPHIWRMPCSSSKATPSR